MTGEAGRRSAMVPGARSAGESGTSWSVALHKTSRQFTSILPIIVGVILVLGFVRTLLTPAMLQHAFSGPPVLDTLKGAGLGSILAGNPINSYIIGGQLLEDGASTYAVTAFVLTWVTVGIVQLPAEATALGVRFAVARNLIAFVLSLPLAALAISLARIIEGLP